MKLVKQKTSTTCGQCCIAMLLQKTLGFITVDAAILLVGHSNVVTDEEMLKMFCAEKFTMGNPPKNIIALQKHKDPNSDREHWTVLNNNVLFDPAQIGSGLWPVYKYLEIK